MILISYSRMVRDKTVSLLRSLNNANRASVSSLQRRKQHTEACNGDEPIEINNPYQKERKLCILCKYNIEPDYKNVRLLSQFQSRFTGRVYQHHITGLCKMKQKKVEVEITKAQNAGLMGFYTKNIMYVNDPLLFDINNPFKPHKY